MNPATLNLVKRACHVDLKEILQHHIAILPRLIKAVESLKEFEQATRQAGLSDLADKIATSKLAFSKAAYHHQLSEITEAINNIEDLP